MGSSLKAEIIFPLLIIAFQIFPPQTTAIRISLPPVFAPSSLPPFQIHPPTKLQAEVCGKAETLDFNLCVEILQSDPQSSAAGDIKALAGAVLQSAKEESAVLSQTFDAILRDGSNPPEWKPAVKLCAFDYKDAAIFFNPRGLGDVTKSLEIHSALDDSDNCEEEMAKSDVKIDDSVAAEIRRWKDLYEVANGAVLYAEDLSGGASMDEDYGQDY